MGWWKREWRRDFTQPLVLQGKCKTPWGKGGPELLKGLLQSRRYLATTREPGSRSLYSPSAVSPISHELHSNTIKYNWKKCQKGKIINLLEFSVMRCYLYLKYSWKRMNRKHLICSEPFIIQRWISHLWWWKPHSRVMCISSSFHVYFCGRQLSSCGWQCQHYNEPGKLTYWKRAWGQLVLGELSLPGSWGCLLSFSEFTLQAVFGWHHLQHFREVF